MPKSTIVLRGATIITSKGDEVLSNADIVITDNRIAAVGKGVKVPAGAKVIDARGKFIVPGFVDTHAHWEFRTHDVLEPQNWSLIANLAYGVTSGSTFRPPPTTTSPTRTSWRPGRASDSARS